MCAAVVSTEEVARLIGGPQRQPGWPWPSRLVATYGGRPVLLEYRERIGRDGSVGSAKSYRCNERQSPQKSMRGQTRACPRLGRADGLGCRGIGADLRYPGGELHRRRRQGGTRDDPRHAGICWAI